MRRQNIGSNFDDFLQGEAMLEEVTAVALKRVIAWQIAEEMKVRQLTKAQLATRMRISRAALDRLLDENDPELTLTTLIRAATALGLKVDIRLEQHQSTAKAKKRKLSAVLLQPELASNDLDFTRSRDTGRNIEQ
jgi:antitoxin HicB